VTTSVGDTVYFCADGQGFNSFTGPVEGKGLQESFQNKFPSKQDTSTL
jgi:hypothetical protein